MISSAWIVALSAALGAGPIGYGGGYEHATHGPAVADYNGGDAYHHGGAYVTGGHPAVVGFAEQLYPFDAPEPWLHGYHQEIPAYGGFNNFRPYNYKHVLSQSQAAGGWGMPPTMPYSQQYWHRYHQQAAMKQHISRVGASEYMAELARLRAREDFEQHRKIASQRQAEPSTQNVPLNLTPNFEEVDPPPTIDPVTYQYLSRLEAMQSKITKQKAQLQSIQQALYEQQQKQEKSPTKKKRNLFRRK